MNKKLMITAAALLAFTSLVGCNIKTGGNTGSSGDNTSSADDPSSSSQVPDTKCTVTFDLNYQGAPAATTVEVEKGDYVNEPEEPTRENYYFKTLILIFPHFFNYWQYRNRFSVITELIDRDSVI